MSNMLPSEGIRSGRWGARAMARTVENGLEDPGASTVVQVAVGEAHTLALAASGSVYTWGRGQFGRMGVGVFQDQLTSTLVEIAAIEVENHGHNGRNPNGQAERSRITQIAAGAYHSLALAVDGTVWSWGFNAYGQLGRQSAASFPAPITFPRSFDQDERSVDGLMKVVAVEASGMMSSAIDNEGGLWLWGAVPEPSAGVQITDSDSYHTSDAFELANIEKPQRVLALRDQRVRRVACGTEHIVALVDGLDTECYAWGSNLYGQLGLGDYEARDMPTPLPVLPQCGTIADVACGAFHSAIVTTIQLGEGWAGSERGGFLDVRLSTCWTFGQNENGQLGLATRANSHTPAAVDALPGRERIQTAACGLFHTAVVMESGDVWVWGMEGGLGQCPGIGPPGSKSGDVLSPVRVFGESSARCNPVSGAKGIACGAAHTVTVSDGGKNLWAWGRGKNGVLGSGHHSDSWFPSPVLWPPGRLPPTSDPDATVYDIHRKLSSPASSKGGSRGRGDEIKPYHGRELDDNNSFGRQFPVEQYVREVEEDRSARGYSSSLKREMESPRRPRRGSDFPQSPGQSTRGAADQDSPSRASRGGDRADMHSPSRSSRRGDHFWSPTQPEVENPRRNFRAETGMGGGFKYHALQSEDVKAELTACRRYAESLHAAIYGGLEDFPAWNGYDSRFDARRGFGAKSSALQDWHQHVEDASLGELAKLELFHKGMRSRLKEVSFQRKMEEWCLRALSRSSYQEPPPPVREPYLSPYFDGLGDLALRLSNMMSDRGENLPPAALAASLAELRLHSQRRR